MRLDLRRLIGSGWRGRQPASPPARGDAGRAPLVSIIVLSFNYARYIGNAIRSMLDQTYPHWELIVVDDASEDESLRVIRSFTDRRIVVIPLAERQGACAAYNVALTRCRGRYVGSLDADDAFLPEKLERQVCLLEAQPDLDVVGTWIVQIDAEGQEVPQGSFCTAVNRPHDFNRLDTWIPSDLLCHSSVLLRKASHDRVGGLNPDLALAPDFELWLRCLSAGLRFALIHERLTCYRAHAANVSHTHDRGQLWLELCFLFVSQTAPLLVRRGRSDLLAPAMAALAGFVGGESQVELRALVLRLLAGFPLLPRRMPALREAVPAALGADWPRVAAAIGGAPALSPAPAPRPAPPRRAAARRGLSIVDDYFPRLDTGFRVAEFNWYLEHTDCRVYSTAADFERVWEEYAAVHPQWADRVRRFDADAAADCSLLYATFLSNAYRALPLAERHGVPLAFTLYPGGGFELWDPRSDLMLSRLGRSSRLAKMIVTQRATLDYVVASGCLPADKMELIWGVASPPAGAESGRLGRRLWPGDKPTCDVCFVANKYMPRGVDKGYDVFVEVARRLAPRHRSFRFHVVGGFGPEDVDLGAAAERTTFHGKLPAHRLAAFFAGMDVIVSPNRAFRLRPGATDGFPTACCTEAALAGVAVLCTDPLGENDAGPLRFAPDEICIVEPDPEEIAARLLALHADPPRLHRLAQRGQARARALYHADRQLAPRLAVLASQMGAGAS